MVTMLKLGHLRRSLCQETFQYHGALRQKNMKQLRRRRL